MGNSALATVSASLGAAIETALMTGDLKDLKVEERISYYNQVCRSLGLNPLTGPFKYIVLNGKLTLYATRDCADQLRKIHRVSITNLEPKQIGDLFVVVASAKDGEGRIDQSTGAVNILNLKGEALANAMMKCETKSKRRVTLSLCGLGLLDETEVETLKQQGVAFDADAEGTSVQHARQPVAMPQPKSEDKPTLNIVEMSNAVIKSRKEGKEDTLWMTTSVGVVVVSATTAAKHPFSIGDAFSFKAVEKTGKEIKFFMVNEVTGYVPHFDDPLPPMEDGPLPEKPKDSMDQAMEEGAFDQNPTGTLEETRKGIVGKKREIRLYTLMTNNKAKTGLTREIVHEILDAMSPPVAHLSDLNMDMYPVFVKIMTGEQDWRDLF